MCCGVAAAGLPGTSLLVGPWARCSERPPVRRLLVVLRAKKRCFQEISSERVPRRHCVRALQWAAMYSDGVSPLIRTSTAVTWRDESVGCANLAPGLLAKFGSLSVTLFALVCRTHNKGFI